MCSVVHDGTTGDGGFEINTAPANGDALLDQINELGEALLVDGATMHTGCGLHVHVDARDYGYQDIRKLVTVYAAIEETLFAAVDPCRYSNGFTIHCGPRYINGILNASADTKLLKKAVVESTYGRDGMTTSGRRAPDFHAYRPQHRAGNRTYALNLHSWFLRGTVEFRIHHGTVDPTVITEWMTALAALLTAVNEKSDAYLRSAVIVPETTSSISRRFGLAVSKWRRNDIDMDATLRGFQVLSRILPDQHLETFATRLRYFGTGGRAAHMV